MDWSKAKTILIVALVITNIILLGVLLTRDKLEDPTMSEEFFASTRDLLSNKGISLATEIPREEALLNSLIVEYKDLNMKKLYREIFKRELRKDSKLTSHEEEIDGILFKVRRNKYFLYENKREDIHYRKLDITKARDIGLDFIRSLDLYEEDMVLSYEEASGSSFRFRYSKKYEDKYVELAYMDLLVDEIGVRKFERVWLNIIDYGENMIRVSGAPKALLSLLDREDLRGRTIVDMDLCHYFDPDEHEYIETPKDPRKGKTIPSWRIQFDNGDIIIIDNHR